MYVIVALDNANGMMFNHRRLSRDRVMLERLIRLAGQLTHAVDAVYDTPGKLRMSPYTAGLFPAGLPDWAESVPNFLDGAGEQDVCFVEDASLAPYRRHITRLYVFRWNRDYPSDCRLDIDLSDWNCSVEDEFPGSSHKSITLECYLPPKEILHVVV